MCVMQVVRKTALTPCSRRMGWDDIVDTCKSVIVSSMNGCHWDLGGTATRHLQERSFLVSLPSLVDAAAGKDFKSESSSDSEKRPRRKLKKGESTFDVGGRGRPRSGTGQKGFGEKKDRNDQEGNRVWSNTWNSQQRNDSQQRYRKTGGGGEWQGSNTSRQGHRVPRAFSQRRAPQADLAQDNAGDTGGDADMDGSLGLAEGSTLRSKKSWSKQHKGRPQGKHKGATRHSQSEYPIKSSKHSFLEKKTLDKKAVKKKASAPIIIHVPADVPVVKFAKLLGTPLCDTCYACMIRA